MKKVLAIVLTLAMLLPTALSLGTVAGAEDFTAKPFYGLGWSDINRVKFPNLEGLTIVAVNKVEEGKLGLSYAGKTEPKEIAASIKKTLDRTPEGMRQLFLAGTGQAFHLAPEDAIFMDNGVSQMKALFTELLTEYHRLGGKLDGFVLDNEYVWMGGWYIYSKFYYRDNKIVNKNIYNEIVANPKYTTEIRPLLVERGFKFYEDVGGEKSEIYSIWPVSRMNSADREKYADCTSIWNTVMDIHIAKYLNYALYEPLMKFYPDATMSDYQEDDTAAWLKSLSDAGDVRGSGGNQVKIGNASNYNTYASRPSSSLFQDDNGDYIYKNLPAFNNAVYENDAYHMFLYDANKFKQMYAATENRRITAWIAEYDYNPVAGSVSNTPYYTENLLHLGMLNPEAFLIYIYSGDSKFKGTNGTAEYNKRMQTISEILNELTRVAGYSDRTPIETPINWNDGFVLSGMYAGGRNVWRLTPDTTEGTTVESFKVKDKAPTFTINGNTIVFPQGRIIKDGSVSVVGTAGYWIETPKDVTPVITREADRYSKYPSFLEDFSGYEEGSVFNSLNARPRQTWEVASTGELLIRGGQLALTGTADLRNITLPGNITAGDSYAKRQAWEISFTLPEAMNAGSAVKLLTTAADAGIKLEGGKVYYDENGTYKELEGVTLHAGQRYTLKRDMNFTVEGAYTTAYSLYSGGSLLKQVANVPMASDALPMVSIGISSSGLTTKVLLDDYKLYPTGLAKDFEVYNGVNGVRLDSAAKNTAKSVAYRLSWLNGTDAGKKFNVKAAYYNSSDALVSESVIKTVEMVPGADGVETGIVQNTDGGKVVVYLEDAGVYTPNQLPNYDNGDFSWSVGAKPTEPPATDSTTVPTVAPTVAPTTAPTVAPTATPTAAPTTDTSLPPATEATAVPTGATEVTTTSQTKAPTDPADIQKSVEDAGGSTGTVVVIAAVALILAGAGIGVFFFLKKKRAAENTDE
ncbi:MAG: hypothetical protein IJ030_03205 [Oscillospiraceae bacterium]|nr:hypothetical protein [Oscillospiraceae bacterium]